MLANGQPSVGTRALTNDEVSELRERYRRARRKRVIWLVTVGLIPFYCVGTLIWTPLQNPGVTLPVIFGSIFAVGWLITQANHSLQIQWIKMGAEATEVQRFPDPADPQGKGEIELTPSTGEVWIPNSSGRKKPIFYEIYSPPAPPPCVALWGSRRSLSEDEADELRRIIAGARKAALVPLPLAALCAVIALVFLVPQSRNGMSMILGIGVCGVTIWEFARMGRKLLSLHPYAKDLRTGQVVDVGQVDKQGRVEMLPNARVMWTANGVPAPWRDVAATAASAHQLPEA